MFRYIEWFVDDKIWISRGTEEKFGKEEGKERGKTKENGNRVRDVQKVHT